MLLGGTLSSIVGVCVFARKRLRKNPCSVYLICLNTANLLYVHSFVILLILSVGFDIDIPSLNDFNCKSAMYFTALFDSLSFSYLIQASIDRTMITSINVSTRRQSTRKFAFISVCSVTLFWCIFHLNGAIMSGVVSMSSNISLCLSKSEEHERFIAYYSLIIKGFLAPVLMTIFGLWTILNIRNIRRRRVIPAMLPADQNKIRGRRLMNSHDRQFILIILIDLVIYIMFVLPLSIFNVIQESHTTIENSFEHTYSNVITQSIFVFVSCVPHCIDLYTNAIVSRSFREEVRSLVKRKNLQY